MSDHPIETLMRTTMENLKAMVDVNTVVGEPVETADGTVIVPVSRVSFGFVAGGGDETYEQGQSGHGQEEEMYSGGGRSQEQGSSEGEAGAARRFPFAGGSGAGVSIRPVAFLVVGNGQVRVLPVDGRAIYDRVLDAVPVFLEKLADLLEFREDGERRVGRDAEGTAVR